MRIIATILTILLLSTIWCPAQRGTMAFVSAAPVTTNTFKQQYVVWDYVAGASNQVSWGLSRGAWTNGTALTLTNQFPVTNGWCYIVTSVVNNMTSNPALWPSNRFDRIWVQTSTNLTNWKDGFIWTTNYNKPQEYLRLRAELLRWE